MLTWDEREDAHKFSPTVGSSDEADTTNEFASADVGNYRHANDRGRHGFITNATLVDELRERFIRLAGGRMIEAMADTEREPQNSALHRARAEFLMSQQRRLIFGRSAAQIARMGHQWGLT